MMVPRQRNIMEYPIISTMIPNPPATISIAARGKMERIPSTFPRNVLSVLSVTHALKQASFAVEPKSVITQSPTTTAAKVIITA